MAKAEKENTKKAELLGYEEMKQIDPSVLASGNISSHNVSHLNVTRQQIGPSVPVSSNVWSLYYLVPFECVTNSISHLNITMKQIDPSVLVSNKVCSL